MKKVIGLVLAFVMIMGCVPALAEDTIYENFIIEETEDTVIIKGCKDTSITSLYIPGVINGKKVVLKEGAFYGYKQYENLESITFGEGIEIIPKELCYCCNKLKNVEISSTVKIIDESAFTSCNSLTQIDLKNVEELKPYALTADNLTKVAHNGKLRIIDDWCFAWTSLKEFDFNGVEFLGNRSFCGTKLESIYLPDLKDWDGIKTSDVDSITKEHNSVQVAYYPLKASELELQKIGTPFMWCNNLKKVVIRYPETGQGGYKSLFIACPNIENVTYENFPAEPSVWEFYKTEVVTENYPIPEGVEYMHKTGWIKTQKKALRMVEPELKFTIHGDGENIQAYAKKLGVNFMGENGIEVEPKIQGIHGGIIDRLYLADRITKIAESMGGTVTVSGDNIAVQKDGKSMAIVGDTAYYMENGKMVTESIFENAYYVKIPEKALESVLGEDCRKSEKYKEFFRTYNGEIYRIEGTIETAYGTLAVVHTNGIMRGFTNSLHFIKWDGEDILVSKKAPYKNPWSPAKWEKIELSQDGKILTITYPQNKKIIEYYYTYGSDKTVLWDEGTYVITANLETGDVKCEIKPLEEKVEEKPAPEKTEPAKTIEHDGMKVGVSILSEPQNGPDNLFDENLISYCVLYVKDEKAPEYMEFDLGEIKDVEKLALAFRDAKTRTTYFDVRVSEDGINYETVIPKRGSNADTNELQYFDINKKARYVRVYGYTNTYNKYWVSITEARVITN